MSEDRCEKAPESGYGGGIETPGPSAHGHPEAPGVPPEHTHVGTGAPRAGAGGQPNAGMMHEPPAGQGHHLGGYWPYAAHPPTGLQGGPYYAPPMGFGYAGVPPGPMYSPMHPAMAGQQHAAHLAPGYPGAGHPGAPPLQPPPGAGPYASAAHAPYGEQPARSQRAGMSELFQEIGNGGNGLSSLAKMLDLDDADFWKGAMIGAAAVLLLTNESVQGMLFGGGNGSKGTAKAEGEAGA